MRRKGLGSNTHIHTQLLPFTLIHSDMKSLQSHTHSGQSLELSLFSFPLPYLCYLPQIKEIQENLRHSWKHTHTHTHTGDPTLSLNGEVSLDSQTLRNLCRSVGNMEPDVLCCARFWILSEHYLLRVQILGLNLAMGDMVHECTHVCVCLCVCRRELECPAGRGVGGHVDIHLLS